MRILLGLAVAGLLAGSICSAQAQEWCGFLDKANSRVRCGFSSIEQCKQALGDKKGAKKSAVCMPSPSFAKRGPIAARKG